MRRIFILLFLLCLTPSDLSICAQTTVSDRTLDITVGNGFWGALLPSYQIGSDQDSNPALSDDGDFFGYQGDLRLVRRFLHTRTAIEGRAFYGTAQSDNDNLVESMELIDPLSGNQILLGEGRANLKTSLDHYGYDLGLRDTWRTRFGGLSAGCLFSYMNFDQGFDISHTNDLVFVQELSSEFIGGKAVFGWDGLIRECPALFDLTLGFYQLRADLITDNPNTIGSVSDYLYANPVTIEASFTTWHDVRDVRVGTTLALTHLDEMPQLVHQPGEQTAIELDDGLMLKLMFEILL